MTTYTPQPGTIIHGTLRLQDVIPALFDELRNVNPVGYGQLITSNVSIPAYVYDEGDDSDWWSTEDAQWLFEALFDALDECAPDGYYFGVHPGDGSDFGYWPIDDEED